MFKVDVSTMAAPKTLDKERVGVSNYYQKLSSGQNHHLVKRENVD